MSNESTAVCKDCGQKGHTTCLATGGTGQSSKRICPTHCEHDLKWSPAGMCCYRIGEWELCGHRCPTTAEAQREPELSNAEIAFRICGQYHKQNAIERQIVIALDAKDTRSRPTADDGSDDWCDDCHGYTHLPNCPHKATEKLPLEKRIVDAVYRSMQHYEDGTWLMDELRANARVKKLLRSRPTVAESLNEEDIRREASRIIREWTTADPETRRASLAIKDIVALVSRASASPTVEAAPSRSLLVNQAENMICNALGIVNVGGRFGLLRERIADALLIAHRSATPTSVEAAGKSIRMGRTYTREPFAIEVAEPSRCTPSKLEKD